MANWYGAARSNYVMVKDLLAFREAMAPWPIRVSVADGLTNIACLLSEEPDSGGWPSSRYDAETDTDVDFDFAALVCPHLVEGQVLVVMEAGAEKLRYLTGWAAAYDHTGRHVGVDLTNIYEAAATAFGVPRAQISACAY